MDFGHNGEIDEMSLFTSQPAPVYGESWNSGACKQMDHQLEVIVEANVQALRAQSSAKPTWSSLHDEMTKNSLIDPSGGEECSTKALVEDDKNSFRLEALATDEPLAKQEIFSNFVNLVGDGDVINATSIKLNSLAESISAAGATIAKLSNGSKQQCLRVTAVLDAGILRYPDIQDPYYKIYCIKIEVFSATEQGLMQTTVRNSVICEYRWRNFKPRPDSLRGIIHQTKDKAVEEAEALFR